MELFSNFKEASKFAKSLAVEHKVTVSLGRRGGAFCVEIPEEIVAKEEVELLEYEAEYYLEEYSYEYHYREHYDYYYQKFQRAIAGEGWDFEEEGWFYED